MKISFELVTALQYELRAAQQLASFKYVQTFVTMKKEHEEELHKLRPVVPS